MSKRPHKRPPDSSCFDWSAKMVRSSSPSERTSVPRHEVNFTKARATNVLLDMAAEYTRRVWTRSCSKRTPQKRAVSLSVQAAAAFSVASKVSPSAELLHVRVRNSLSTCRPPCKPCLAAKLPRLKKRIRPGFLWSPRPALNRTCLLRISSEQIFLPFDPALLPQNLVERLLRAIGTRHGGRAVSTRAANDHVSSSKRVSHHIRRRPAQEPSFPWTLPRGNTPNWVCLGSHVDTAISKAMAPCGDNNNDLWCLSEKGASDGVELRNVYARDSSRFLPKRAGTTLLRSVRESPGLQNVVLDRKGKGVFGTMLQHEGGTASHLAQKKKSNWLAAVKDSHLICGQPSCVLAMLSMPDGRRFPNGFSPISGSVFRRRPAPPKKTIKKKNACFCFFWVKKHGVAFPEVIEKYVLLWRCGDRRARWRRRRGGVQRWINYVRGSSTQCVLPADQTRITSCRLQASVVTKVVANTTPIKQKKK